MQTMNIGRLAQLAQVNIDTIRSLTADRKSDMRGVKRKAMQRQEQVDQKIAELRRVKRGLKKLIDACPGQGELEACPIVAALCQGTQNPGDHR